MNSLNDIAIEAGTALGMQIRSCAPGQYKTGQWGTVIGTEVWSDRVVWHIMWPGGALDHWNVEDESARYEIGDLNTAHTTADNAIRALGQISDAIHLDDTTPGIRAPRVLRNQLVRILHEWRDAEKGV